MKNRKEYIGTNT